MANVIRIKRRAAGGAAGAPSSLKTSEVAYSEVDDIIYIGFGDDGAGNATSIRAFAGKGAFVDLSSAQTISGAKTFSASPAAPTPTAGDNTTKVATTAFVATATAAAGNMLKSVYDTNNNGIVDNAELAISAGNADALGGLDSGQYATKTYADAADATKQPLDSDLTAIAALDASTAGSIASDGTGWIKKTYAQLKTALGLVKADVGLGNVDNTSDVTKFTNTPLTGVPTAPTPAAGTNTTQIPTTAFVITEIAARLASTDVMVYKGAIDASANPNYPGGGCRMDISNIGRRQNRRSKRRGR